MSLVLIPILAQALTASAGDRCEVRLRNAGTDGTSVDLITRGQLALSLSSTRVRWGLSYSPVLTELDVLSGNATLMIQHLGGLQGSFQLTPRTNVNFAETVTYGQQNLRLLPLSAPAPQSASTAGASSSGTTQGESSLQARQVTPVVGVESQTVRFGSTMTTLGVSHRLGPLWQTLARAGYWVSGGLDAESRLRVPRAETVSAGATLAHTASQRDRLSLETDAYSTATATLRRASVVMVSVRWNRQFSRQITGGISGGASYARTSTEIARSTLSDFSLPRNRPYSEVPSDNQSISETVFPVGSADLRATQVWHKGLVSAGLAEQVVPFVDRFTGAVLPRSETTLDATWSKRRLSIGAMGSLVRALSTNNEGNELRYSYAFSQFASYNMRRHWQFELGARQTWVAFSNSTEVPMIWSTYLAVSYTTGDVRL